MVFLHEHAEYFISHVSIDINGNNYIAFGLTVSWWINSMIGCGNQNCQNEDKYGFKMQKGKFHFRDDRNIATVDT